MMTLKKKHQGNKKMQKTLDMRDNFSFLFELCEEYNFNRFRETTLHETAEVTFFLPSNKEFLSNLCFYCRFSTIEMEKLVKIKL